MKKMRLNKLAILTISLLACVWPITAQEKSIAYEVPEKHIALWLLNDPASPVQIKAPKKVFGFNNGAVGLGYEFQNVSDTNVETIDFKETDWTGSTGFSSEFKIRRTSGYNFMPYSSEYTFESDRYVVRSFEENQAKELKFLNWRNRIWIAMVVKVKLSNGKMFDISKKFENLEKFFDDLHAEESEEGDESKIRSEKNLANELTIREAKLKEFISKLKLVIS